MKRNKEDFFEQMEDYKTSFTKGDIICAFIALICFAIAFTLLMLILADILQFNAITIAILVGLAVIFIIAIINTVVCLFSINKELFISGKLSAGLRIFISIAFLIYFILFILWLAVPNWKESLSTIFKTVTSLVVPILTIMGVYYTIAKQQKEKDESKNLIFALCDEADSAENYSIINSFGNNSIEIKLKNISNNFGYLVGVYRICGCDIHQVGAPFPYFLIKPNSSYLITNVRLNFGDDQLMVVYKDIGKNYYYLLLSSNYEFIEDAGKCDMDFLKCQLAMTEKSEKKVKKFADKKSLETTNADEKFIFEQKEKTKPINTIRENGFDLIRSSSGDTLTDVDLLSKLKKERTRMAKEQQIKPYMIFNNQQLVAMATYKPYDELSFISIYGLGKKKYELYGEQFLAIIAENSKTNTDAHQESK